MKNLIKLGLILGIGSMSVFSLGACSGDEPEPGAAAGAGTTAGAGNTAGAGGAGTAGMSSTAGNTSTAGKGGAGTAGSAGAGTAGGGGGGAGTAGSGGSTGGGGAGTAGGGAGGGPSADCTKWCSGANGLIAQCAGMLAPAVDTEAKCIANCTKPAASGVMGLECWLKHLDNIVAKGEMKSVHCPHTSGADGNQACNETE